jgi:hypothetical protein
VYLRDWDYTDLYAAGETMSEHWIFERVETAWKQMERAATYCERVRMANTPSSMAHNYHNGMKMLEMAGRNFSPLPERGANSFVARTLGYSLEDTQAFIAACSRHLYWTASAWEDAND